MAALASGTLMWVMVQGVPSPTTFYSWIASLIAIAAVVLPFLAVNPWQSALGTGLIHGVLGVVIIVLTEVVAAKAGAPRVVAASKTAIMLRPIMSASHPHFYRWCMARGAVAAWHLRQRS